MKFIDVVRGCVALCHLDERSILVSQCERIFTLDTETGKTKFLCRLPSGLFEKAIFRLDWFSRFFRFVNIYGVKVSSNSVLVVFNRNFYEVSLESGEIRHTYLVKRGRRPLSIVNIEGIPGFDEGLYFGEYLMNFEKAPVGIYRRNGDSSWSNVFTFSEGEIEHVHSLVPDPSNACVWILTGDFGQGAAIWVARNNFSTVYPVVRGKQIYRACVAFAVDGGLLYATDSQFEENTIRFLSKKGGEWLSEEICKLNGPCINGQACGDNFLFSTSVEGDSDSKGFLFRFLDREPAPGVKEPFSHLVVGNPKTGFDVVYKAKKDFLPFILFHFGVLVFPTGEPGSRIFVNPIALAGTRRDCLVFSIDN